MQLSQIRDLALKIINSYSADGETLPLSDTADFRLACTDFINTALNKWCQKDKLEDSYTIVQDGTEPEVKPYNIYTLPSDFIGLNKITFQKTDEEEELFTNFLLSNSKLKINYLYEGTFEVYYYKRPTELINDADIPEIDSRYHKYLAYYAAGEWQFSSGKQQDGLVRLNQFDSFLSEMHPSINTSSTRIENTNGW